MYPSGMSTQRRDMPASTLVFPRLQDAYFWISQTVIVNWNAFRRSARGYTRPSALSAFYSEGHFGNVPGVMGCIGARKLCTALEVVSKEREPHRARPVLVT